ncbi:kanadaptin-like isoform X2 [Haliotis rubra]|uniref:kanadaptin-like isoform X2 n=1 Tax=Haliotis rubra TaxID=36100 RepID=UPI001EE5C9E4|nr:kanadaptin-like isoform X2 [Haliotis rubra]
MEDNERSPPVSGESTTTHTPTDTDNTVTSVDSGKTIDENTVTMDCLDFKVPGSMPVPTTSPLSSEVKLKTKSNSSEEDTEAKENNATVNSSGQDTNSKQKTDTKSNASGFSPAEQLRNAQVTIPYKEPSWSGLCDESYQFEVLKNGSIIDNVDLTKQPFYVFGRLPSCDVTMEHPSLSRYHAVVQFSASDSEKRAKGWYLYDLDSTHGTWINKVKVKPKVYNRVRVGHVVKFGGSSRLHILQGPDDDKEEESDLSVTEIKEQRERQKKEAEVLHQAELIEEETRMQKEKQRLEDKGCTWGIDEDAEEANEDSPFMPSSLIPENEHLYIDDPKKALKGYFEREGYDLPEYQFVECGQGKHKCMVELPVDTPTGEPVVAEVVVSGKRKDAVVACALEACRLLDKYGELRKSKHESHKRKEKNWEDNDFYDSDEDTFLDRTGTIEKKRVQRMKKAGKIEDKAETYDSLMTKHTNVSKEIEEIEAKLEKAKADAAAFDNEEVDALDAYMSAIKSGVMDTKTKMKLKRQLIELKQEEQKLRRLVNLAKPASLPELKKFVPPPPKPVVKAAIPSVGKIHVGPRKHLPVPTQTRTTISKGADEEEEEEEEEESVTSTDCNRNTSMVGGERLQSEEPDSTSGKVKAPAKVPPSVSMESVSSSTVKGPAMPPPPSAPSQSAESVSSSSVKAHGKASPSPAGSGVPDSTEELSQKNVDTKAKKRSSLDDVKVKSKKPKTSGSKQTGGYDDTDPDYAVWMPPQGQSGDGKTHLNAKYGY